RAPFIDLGKEGVEPASAQRPARAQAFEGAPRPMPAEGADHEGIAVIHAKPADVAHDASRSSLQSHEALVAPEVVVPDGARLAEPAARLRRELQQDLDAVSDFHRRRRQPEAGPIHGCVALLETPRGATEVSVALADLVTSEEGRRVAERQRRD